MSLNVAAAARMADAIEAYLNAPISDGLMTELSDSVAWYRAVIIAETYQPETGIYYGYDGRPRRCP